MGEDTALAILVAIPWTFDFCYEGQHTYHVRAQRDHGVSKPLMHTLSGGCLWYTEFLLSIQSTEGNPTQVCSLLGEPLLRWESH